MLRSKVDGPPPISGDDVVIFRLQSFCREARRAQREAPALAPARTRVEGAPCSIFPEGCVYLLLKHAAACVCEN